MPEAELQNIYQDLLAFPEQDKTALREPSNTCKIYKVPDLIQILEDRLPSFETAVDANTTQTGLSSRLLARLRTTLSHTEQETELIMSQHGFLLENGSPLRKMINRLRSVIDKMDATWRRDVGGPSSELSHVPFGMLSNTEWNAFSQACVSERISFDVGIAHDLIFTSSTSMMD